MVGATLVVVVVSLVPIEVVGGVEEPLAPASFEPVVSVAWSDVSDVSDDVTCSGSSRAAVVVVDNSVDVETPISGC